MRAQCLLECYYGERLLTETAQSFSGPVLFDEITCQASPQHLEHSLQSDELPERWYCQARAEENLLRNIKNHEIHDPLNEQMQAIRNLGVHLRRVADYMEIRPANSFLDVNPTALINEGLSSEEIQVVRRIYSERASTTISNIARHLQECLTSRTFRMALAFLSSSTSSVSEELTAACELARVIYPQVHEVIEAGPIYDELQEFIEDKLDEIFY